jgi:hypothetical protein
MSMTAIIIDFPLKRRLDVRVERERNDLGWLVLAPDGNGWAHGCWSAAIDDARKIARDYSVAVISSAGRWMP